LFSLLLVSKLVLSELFRVLEYNRAAWSGLDGFEALASAIFAFGLLQLAGRGPS